jgi:hypothetical protein
LQPSHHLLGALVWRKYWVENLAGDAGVDDEHHALEKGRTNIPGAGSLAATNYIHPLGPKEATKVKIAMTPAQYRDALTRLGLTQVAAARLLGMTTERHAVGREVVSTRQHRSSIAHWPC